MARCWIGVASRDHVQRGVAGGFCQLGHGKEAGVAKLRPGDRIIYYSPRARFDDPTPLQAFTAIGEVLEGAPRQVEMSGGFRPFRRDVRFFAASEAPIRPLLPQLGFTRERPNWGYAFRRGAFTIDLADYQCIARAMGVTDAPPEG